MKAYAHNYVRFDQTAFVDINNNVQVPGDVPRDSLGALQVRVTMAAIG